MEHRKLQKAVDIMAAAGTTAAGTMVTRVIMAEETVIMVGMMAVGGITVIMEM